MPMKLRDIARIEGDKNPSITLFSYDEHLMGIWWMSIWGTHLLSSKSFNFNIV